MRQVDFSRGFALLGSVGVLGVWLGALGVALAQSNSWQPWVYCPPHSEWSWWEESTCPPATTLIRQDCMPQESNTALTQQEDTDPTSAAHPAWDTLPNQETWTVQTDSTESAESFEPTPTNEHALSGSEPQPSVEELSESQSGDQELEENQAPSVCLDENGQTEDVPHQTGPSDPEGEVQSMEEYFQRYGTNSPHTPINTPMWPEDSTSADLEQTQTLPDDSFEELGAPLGGAIELLEENQSSEQLSPQKAGETSDRQSPFSPANETEVLPEHPTSESQMTPDESTDHMLATEEAEEKDEAAVQETESAQEEETWEDEEDREATEEENWEATEQLDISEESEQMQPPLESQLMPEPAEQSLPDNQDVLSSEANAMASSADLPEQPSPTEQSEPLMPPEQPQSETLPEEAQEVHPLPTDEAETSMSPEGENLHGISPEAGNLDGGPLGQELSPEMSPSWEYEPNYGGGEANYTPPAESAQFSPLEEPMDSGKALETEEAIESQEAVESKEFPESEEPMESGEALESEKALETKEAIQSEEAMESKELPESEEPMESEEALESEKASETEEAIESEEPMESKELPESEEPMESEEALESEKALETKEAIESEEAMESKGLLESEEPMESEEALESEKALETEEAEEVGVAPAGPMENVSQGPTDTSSPQPEQIPTEEQSAPPAEFLPTDRYEYPEQPSQENQQSDLRAEPSVNPPAENPQKEASPSRMDSWQAAGMEQSESTGPAEPKPNASLSEQSDLFWADMPGPVSESASPQTQTSQPQFSHPETGKYEWWLENPDHWPKETSQPIDAPESEQESAQVPEPSYNLQTPGENPMGNEESTDLEGLGASEASASGEELQQSPSQENSQAGEDSQPGLETPPAVPAPGVPKGGEDARLEHPTLLEGLRRSLGQLLKPWSRTLLGLWDLSDPSEWLTGTFWPHEENPSEPGAAARPSSAVAR